MLVKDRYVAELQWLGIAKIQNYHGRKVAGPIFMLV